MPVRATRRSAQPGQPIRYERSTRRPAHVPLIRACGEPTVGMSVQARTAGPRSAGCLASAAQARRLAGCVPAGGPQRSVQAVAAAPRPCGQYVIFSNAVERVEEAEELDAHAMIEAEDVTVKDAADGAEVSAGVWTVSDPVVAPIGTATLSDVAVTFVGTPKTPPPKLTLSTTRSSARNR